MSIVVLLVLLALAAAVLLTLPSTSRTPGLVALVASGVEALMAFGFLSIKLRGLNLYLVLGAALAIAGAIAWAKVPAKVQVTAATVLVLVGGLQIITALR